MQSLDEGIQYIWNNLSLTLKDIENILMFNVDSVTQKIDGTFLSFTFKNNEVRFARNNKDIKNGGISSQELCDRYNTEFCKSIKLFQTLELVTTLFHKLNWKEINFIFNEGINWYPFEITYSNPDHVIFYRNCNIVFHEFPIIGNNQYLKDLFKFINNNAIQKLNNNVVNLYSPLYVQKIDNQHEAIQQIKLLFDQFNLTQNSTLEDYLICEAQHIFNDQLNNITKNSQFKISLIKRIIQTKNCPSKTDLVKFAKILSIHKTQYESLINKLNKELIFKRFINAIMCYANNILPNIANQLNGEISQAKIIELLQAKLWAQTNLEYHQFTQDELLTIENVIPLEGVVISYKGIVYKITGKFANANKLLNLFRKHNGRKSI